MALPTEVIEALTQGKPLPKKKLDQAWVNPILDLIQAGIVRPTKALWGWEVKWGGGRTLAHEAAKRGPLPEGFDAWALADQNGWTVAQAVAEYGHLPEGFVDRWNFLMALYDRTVAHVIATRGHLPQGFDQWHWADQDGWTVAHVAAARGHLPEDFSQWALANKSGWTVAHVAAQYGHLPNDFDQWALADKNGWTVAHVAAQRGHLPKDFSQWTLADRFGYAVAHVAAAYGHLPEDFDQWHLADQDGRTVAEVAINRLKDRAKESPPPKDHLDFWLAPTSKGCPVMDLALEMGLISSETYEAIQQAILKAQQAQDQARIKTLSGMVF